MLWTTCKLFLVLTFLTGCIYPFLVTEIAIITMPFQANGSLIYQDGKLRGSELIVQPFTGEQYFWPRPSASNYNTLRSSGSNLGPTSKKLKEQVNQRAQKLAQSHPNNSASLPIDLLYASGSGLDPHISMEAIDYQKERVIRARSLSPEDQEKLSDIIDNQARGRIGLFGPLHVNVFLLNKQLDEQFPTSKKP